jgi:hypothetical protein
VIFRNLGWRRELPRRKNGLLLKTLRRTAGTYSNGYGKTFRRCASGSF